MYCLKQNAFKHDDMYSWESQQWNNTAVDETGNCLIEMPLSYSVALKLFLSCWWIRADPWIVAPKCFLYASDYDRLRSIIWALDFKLLHYHTNWNLCSMSRKLGRPWKKWQDIIQKDLKDIRLTWDVERELAHSWSSWFSVAAVCLSHGMNRSRFSSVTLAVDMWLVGPNALPGPLVVSKHNRSCMLINT